MAKKVISLLLTVIMLASMLPLQLFAVEAPADPTLTGNTSTMENQNQAGGIIYTKTSTAMSDGNVNITLTAHTTGEVRNMTSVTPTDIVLVLDVSGSMDENYTTTTETYNAVTGGTYEYWAGFLWWGENVDAYGLEDTYEDYYINTGTQEAPVYTHVTYAGRDANEFEMYEYSEGNTEVVVYPALSENISASREHADYSVKQFYSVTTTRTSVEKMELLKEAVNSFIDTTATMNTGLATSDMHTISIVKFADDSYYNSTTPTVTEGNHKNSSDYNYSEVVKDLTPVDAKGAAALKEAVDALKPGGATAVDFGLNLAEAVLMDRSVVVDESAVDRNEVIVVFTDGEPNHQNGFDENVANAAIATAGNMESQAGVKIYGVCIASGADATDLDADINKFMHYMSSNYPEATSMDSAESGCDTTAGYYMTPDESTSLSMIFDSIIEEIDHPTITLGEEATVVDTLSPYFDFAVDEQLGALKEVTLSVSNSNGDGTWTDPEEDSSLSYGVVGDVLTVTGFDFDANFVSTTPRGVNDDFYGARLVISFVVTPDYGVIDAAGLSLADGEVPTNTVASLNDSDSTPAAEVATPELNTHTVTYRVEGQEDVTYSRFYGAEITVDAAPTKTGYTFSGWNYPSNISVSNGAFAMPDEDVVITGTFTANKYNVTYVYSGAVPVDATDLSSADFNGNTANQNVAYGTTVTVSTAVVSAAGYTFSGWEPLEQDVTIMGGTFLMPDHAVTLRGTFSPAGNTGYQIIHYLETMTDGEYEAQTPETRSGTTDDTAVAVPKYFEGFTFDEDNANNLLSGTIAADGSLILKVYYDRNEYDVTYSYAGAFSGMSPA